MNIQQIIKEFDAEYYLELYSDLRNNNIYTRDNALRHFLQHGYKEGRKYKRTQAITNISKNYIFDNNSRNDYYGLISNFKFSKKKNFNNTHSWQAVENAISIIHNDIATITFDTFLEGSFLLEKNTESYKKEWVGILHYVPSKNKKYNENKEISENIFDNIYFIESLKYCKGLFTLSTYHKKYIDDTLKSLNLDIQVQNIIHPTYIDVIDENKFNIQKYNQNKKIIQIGWYNQRQTTIYLLHFKYPKYILLKKGTQQLQYLNKELSLIDKKNIYSANIPKIINEVDDYNYNKLLGESIIFLDFYDVSSSNIVLECINSNTPLLVNNIGGISEYLGNDYPFYYSSIEEASIKLENTDLIIATTEYLKKMDKTRFTFVSFIHDIIYSNIHIHINSYDKIQTYDILIKKLKNTYNNLENLHIDWYFYIHYNNLIHEKHVVFNKNQKYRISDIHDFIFIIRVAYKEFLFKIFDKNTLQNDKSMEYTLLYEAMKNNTFNTFDTIIKYIHSSNEYIVKSNSYGLYTQKLITNIEQPKIKSDIVYIDKNKKQSITIICLFRDNENILNNFLHQFIECEEYYKQYIFEYVFYENDSVDKTLTLLQEFLHARNGYVISDILRTEKYGDTMELERVKNMSYYRNQSIKKRADFTSDWTMVIDTDIYFEKDIIHRFIDTYNTLLRNNNNQTIGMLLPNGLDINIECKNRAYHKCNMYHYYDTWAFIDRENNNYLEYGEDNGKQSRCNPFKYCDKDIQDWYNDMPVEVHSGFGGLFFMPTHILQNKDVFWSYFDFKFDKNGGCEHWLFCKRVRKYGKIYICPNVFCFHDRLNLNVKNNELFHTKKSIITKKTDYILSTISSEPYDNTIKDDLNYDTDTDTERNDYNKDIDGNDVIEKNNIVSNYNNNDYDVSDNDDDIHIILNNIDEFDNNKIFLDKDIEQANTISNKNTDNVEANKDSIDDIDKTENILNEIIDLYNMNTSTNVKKNK